MSEDDKTEAVVGSALVSEWSPTPLADGNALYRYVQCKGRSEAGVALGGLRGVWGASTESDEAGT